MTFKKIIDIKSNPDEKSTLIFNALRADGKKVIFSKDGALLVENVSELCAVKVKFELTHSFWSPPSLVVRASSIFSLRNLNKSTLELLMSDKNPTDKGILLAVQPAGKSFVIELSMFSTIDSFTNSQAQYMHKEIFIKFQEIFEKLN